jgi:hypothetical protein
MPRAARLVLLALLAPAVAAGQATTGSRYLTDASWTAPFLDHLDRAGLLPGLDPLTRPLSRRAVARAVSAVDTAGLAPAVTTTLGAIATELADPVHAARWALDGRIGMSAASDPSRWILRPFADSAGLYPTGALEASVEFPYGVLVTKPTLDNRLKYDPTYLGKKDRVIAGRDAATYVLASGRWFGAFLGRVDRNWGPPETHGLLLSPVPYSLDHLLVRFGGDRLRLEMLASQLDPIVPWDTATPEPVQRWLVSHRLVVHPSARLAFSLGESILYAGDALPWRFLNPATLGLLTIYDAGPEANALLAADAVWHAGRATRLFGQLLVDDLQVDNSTQGDQEPPAYGLTLGASGGLGRGRFAWTASYTRVSNLAYRTPLNEHQYSVDGLGIAREYSDYDEAQARLTVLAAPGLLLGGSVAVQRQGEGDFHQPYPPVDAFADSLTFLTGTVSTAVQPGLEAAWSPRPWVMARLSLGYRSTSDAGHVAGASEDRWVWRVGVSLRRRYAGTFPTDHAADNRHD